MISVITKKGKLLFFIPFVILTMILMYSWLIFILTEYEATVSHYIGLLFFILIVYFIYKDRTLKKPVVMTLLYLILATINLLAFLPFIVSSSFGMNIMSLKIGTPSFNVFSFIFLLFYGILNFNTVVEIYLDYKEVNGKL